MLHLKHISKSFGELVVFNDLNLEAPSHRLTCILGPSGSGKTTILQLISGLLKPDSGEVESSEDRTISYIFQEPRLLQWKTVAGNLDFVLKRQYPSLARKEIIKRYLDIVELSDFARYYPYQLSGGMRQRVAIARAFAYPSGLLLMDEPFSGLDLALKQSLIEAFIRLWRQDQRTAFFVTHDIGEALLLADEILVLSNRPAQVKQQISIPVPQWERNLNDPDLLDNYKLLYQLVTNNQ